MRTKDSEVMQSIADGVDEFYDRYGRTPSTRELAQRLGISHTTVRRYLNEMRDRRMLDYTDGVITTEKISKTKLESVSIPILGSISCGIPLAEEENVDSYVRLPAELIGHGEFYLLKANGDSMIEAGIDDGDSVLIQKTAEANDGDIVVALVDNENTLKRIFRDNENGKVILHPENSYMEDIVTDYCEIQGVAVMVLKDLRSKVC